MDRGSAGSTRVKGSYDPQDANPKLQASQGNRVMPNDVLIIGAGPSGLFAAAELARHGVQARLIERDMRPHREAPGFRLAKQERSPHSTATSLRICFPTKPWVQSKRRHRTPMDDSLTSRQLPETNHFIDSGYRWRLQIGFCSWHRRLRTSSAASPSSSMAATARYRGALGIGPRQ